jgi:hypothetical protein
MGTGRKTTQITARLDTEALRAFDLLAQEAGVDRSGYLQLWVTRIARVKRGYAIRALDSFPDEILKGLPGRPTDEDAGKVT